LSKYPIKKITLKEEGVSTLAPRKIWFDDTVRRLNIDKRGQFLGEFKAGDKILCVNQSGNYKLSNYSLSNHFEEDMILLEKFNPKKPISTVYWDGDKKQFNVKRFLIEETDRKVLFITEHENSYLELVSSDWKPVIEVIYSKVKGKERAPEKHELEDLITVKGIKALGNRLTKDKVKMINMLDSIPFEEPIEEGVSNQEDKEDSDEKQGSLGFE
jgi:topoisomerase-4 subunit A